MKPRALLTLLAILLAGCDARRDFRTYVERTTEPAPAPEPGKLSWTTPEGWVERPGNDVRIVSFDAGGAECTVVAFPGAAGGVDGNLARWLGQLGLEGSPERVETLKQTASEVMTADGRAVAIYDFSSQLPAGAATNMMAAILTGENRTLFIKLMGLREDVAAHGQAFLALCRSLQGG